MNGFQKWVMRGLFLAVRNLLSNGIISRREAAEFRRRLRQRYQLNRNPC